MVEKGGGMLEWPMGINRKMEMQVKKCTSWKGIRRKIHQKRGKIPKIRLFLDCKYYKTHI